MKRPTNLGLGRGRSEEENGKSKGGRHSKKEIAKLPTIKGILFGKGDVFNHGG